VGACPDPAQRERIAHILAEGVEVIAVADGAAALQAVHEHLADLVLSAVVMPHVGRFELLTALRADPAVHLVPVIFVVEHADTARPGGDPDMAADNYLVEPFSPCRAPSRARLSPAGRPARAARSGRSESSRGPLERRADQLVPRADQLAPRMSHWPLPLPIYYCSAHMMSRDAFEHLVSKHARTAVE
jgi:CheY-like chemotaxis protein